jgi:threonine/homoserine/homoserine lactone efflux protein
MTGIIITMAIAGLLAGFIFSMPIAGPVSILITSSALHGRRSYCNLAAIGASFADFFYVFIAVFGLTKLYSLYKPAMPYILLAGTLFLIYIGYKTLKTKVNIEHLEEEHPEYRVPHRERGAIYTGFMVNFLNPTLFFGWLASSFFVISFLASLGFNTGGLDTIINENVKEMTTIEGVKIDNPRVFDNPQFDKIREWNKTEQEKHPVNLPKHFHLIISTCYAFFLSVGSIIWFFALAALITKYRHHINVRIINGIVFSMGIFLCIFGLYFGYVAVKMILSGAH